MTIVSLQTFHPGKMRPNIAGGPVEHIPLLTLIILCQMQSSVNSVT